MKHSGNAFVYPNVQPRLRRVLAASTANAAYHSFLVLLDTVEPTLVLFCMKE